MKKAIILFSLLLCLSLPAQAAAPPADLLAKAEGGNAAAALEIGRLYAAGTGVPQDNYEAVFWMLVALRMGSDIEDEIKTVAHQLTKEQKQALFPRVQAWKHAHPGAFPAPAPRVHSIGENIAGWLVILLLAVFGFGFQPWIIYRVSQWFIRHKSVVTEQLPENLRGQYKALRLMQYICCVLPLLPLIHFRLWTFLVTVIFFSATYLLKRKLEPALLEAGKK